MSMTFPDFLRLNKVFKPSDIKFVLEMSMTGEKLRSKKKIKYYDTPCSFDIETTSFIDIHGNKCAIMYEWTLGLNGLVIIGRTWEELEEVFNTINEFLSLSNDKILVIYIHNLSYEFQFLCRRYVWQKVFAIDNRKPIYAIMLDYGIELRCSYLLSGYNLAKLAENLTIVNIQKLVGDLDYSLLRHSNTKLTKKEIMYCVNDVKIVMAYIYERIQLDGGITKIPMTKTGYVRQYCRKKCFYGNQKGKYRKNREYYELMQNLTLTLDEYKQAKRAFQGGFTHANPFYSGQILFDVSSDDFTSSYPTVMVSELYPMSSGELIDIKSKKDFNDSLKYYCCLFDAEFEDLEPRVLFDNYISLSRCWDVKEPSVNNGRLVSAKHICITLTEQDFNIIKCFYKWKHFRVANFRRYKKSYLPKPLIESILKLYSDKTTLKGVDGKEVEYLQSKEQLNSCYGMMVTDIIRDEYTYTEEWDLNNTDPEKAIEKYNTSQNRFLFYLWGIWVTAYARRNLFTGIIEFKDDYVYSDTDSIKTLNREAHLNYIKAYNDMIRKRLYHAMDFHSLPYDMIEPTTIKGEKKCLGLWDYEGTYTRFKTLGAKRYMVEKDGKINITVSGLNKKICVPYLKETYGEKIFENFNDNLYVPKEYTGKNTHTYIDEERSGILTDYLGVKCEYHELSSVHLEQADYNLSLSEEYINYITQLKQTR